MTLADAAFATSEMGSTALIIDDSEIGRELLKNVFAPHYDIEETDNGAEGLDRVLFAPEKYCVILLDLVMPGMSGVDVLRVLHERGLTEQIPVFLITAEVSDDVIRGAYDLGVMDVLGKPVVPYVVVRRVQSIVELFRARRRLSHTVREQQVELLQQARQIMDLHNGLIASLSTAIEFRNGESGEHVRRIHDITRYLLTRTVFARDVSVEDATYIALASIMHDVGKIAIPDAILNKPGRLTAEEYEIMKTHTVQGARLLEQIPQLRQHRAYAFAHDIALHHHERWDGRGYPDGLKGDECSLAAQVVALADVYDALVSKRVYKDALSPDTALQMIGDGQCGVFNPVLLREFFGVEKELREFVFRPAAS